MIAQNPSLITLIISLILFLLALWLYLRQPPEPKPPDDRQPKPIATGQLYVPEQVVIIGPPDVLYRVLSTVEENLNITLRPLDRTKREPPEASSQSSEYAESVEKAVETAVAPEIAAPIPPSDAAMAFAYSIIQNGSSDAPVSEQQVVDEINRLGRDSGVVASHNHIIGRPVTEFSGDPDCTEGLPLNEAITGITVADAEKRFLNQWGFKDGSGGINLFAAANGPVNENNKANLHVFSGKKMGDGVTVAVFDTSPYDDTDVPGPSGNTIVSSWQHTELPGVPDARDHGYFIASLVKTVAPRATIHIIRVLNDSNKGVLSILIRELTNFIDKQEKSGDIKKTVINLSLGVSVEWTERASNKAVVALHDTLKRAHDLGATIVAASGNDSSPFVDEGQGHQLQQIPAAYKFVIGVGACNFDGKIAKFSNLADIYAPGGDALLNTSNPCGVEARNCVIGRVQDIDPKSGFAYWRGTSFAAPLVSGYAALLLSNGSTQAQAKTKILGTAVPQAAASSIRLLKIA